MQASNANKFSKLLWRVAISLFSLVLVIFVVVVISNVVGERPSDAKMIQHFQEHQIDFEKLASSSNPKNPSLMKQTGINWTDESERHIKRFAYWGNGGPAVGYNEEEGYAYAQTIPKHVVATLDNISPKVGIGNELLLYRHFSGHWYLYYDYQG